MQKDDSEIGGRVMTKKCKRHRQTAVATVKFRYTQTQGSTGTAEVIFFACVANPAAVTEQHEFLYYITSSLWIQHCCPLAHGNEQGTKQSSKECGQLLGLILLANAKFILLYNIWQVIT